MDSFTNEFNKYFNTTNDFLQNVYNQIKKLNEELEIYKKKDLESTEIILKLDSKIDMLKEKIRVLESQQKK